VLVIGEIMETYIREDCLVSGRPSPSKIDPLVFSVGTMEYHQWGNVIGRAFRMGKNE